LVERLVTASEAGDDVEQPSLPGDTRPSDDQRIEQVETGAGVIGGEPDRFVAEPADDVGVLAFAVLILLVEDHRAPTLEQKRSENADCFDEAGLPGADSSHHDRV